MQTPANFDSVHLDGILHDWLGAMRQYAVEALLVLGPNAFGEPGDRDVIAVHPPVALDVARALAESRDFGSAWSESDAPLVAWQHIGNVDQLSASRWRMLCLARGYRTMIRVEFSLPAGRAFECFMFSPREFLDRSEASSLVWSALNIWPVVRRSIAAARCSLSPREIECLALAFQGYTARQSSTFMGCSERTVNYHVANALKKLKVDNKLAAIQRACWLGAI